MAEGYKKRAQVQNVREKIKSLSGHEKVVLAGTFSEKKDESRGAGVGFKCFCKEAAQIHTEIQREDKQVHI